MAARPAQVPPPPARIAQARHRFRRGAGRGGAGRGCRGKDRGAAALRTLPEELRGSGGWAGAGAVALGVAPRRGLRQQVRSGPLTAASGVSGAELAAGALSGQCGRLGCGWAFNPRCPGPEVRMALGGAGRRSRRLLRVVPVGAGRAGRPASPPAGPVCALWPSAAAKPAGRLESR